MLRFLTCLVVLALACPAHAGKISEDKNWGDKQTARGKQSDKVQQTPKLKPKLHEKEGKFKLEEEKIVPMKEE